MEVRLWSRSNIAGKYRSGPTLQIFSNVSGLVIDLILNFIYSTMSIILFLVQLQYKCFPLSLLVQGLCNHHETTILKSSPHMTPDPSMPFFRLRRVKNDEYQRGHTYGKSEIKDKGKYPVDVGRICIS